MDREAEELDRAEAQEPEHLHRGRRLRWGGVRWGGVQGGGIRSGGLGGVERGHLGRLGDRTSLKSEAHERGHDGALFSFHGAHAPHFICACCQIGG